MALRNKLVVVVDADMDRGGAANAAAVAALALGRRLDGPLGADGKDASGGVHAGIDPHPIPTLAADPERIRALYEAGRERDGVTAVGFTDTARRARDYGSYLEDLSRTGAEELVYRALALFGPKARVNALTKRLPLLK